MLFRAVAHSGHTAENEDELSFLQGAPLDVLEYREGGRAVARDPLTGEMGIVSASLLDRITTYDALERGWDDKATEDPVLGFVTCDFCGEGEEELSVFHYDIVQILQRPDLKWIRVRLQIPNDSRTLVGLVPRGCVEIQQVCRNMCERNQIKIDLRNNVRGDVRAESDQDRRDCELVPGTY